jgi:hypothetical protein
LKLQTQPKSIPLMQFTRLTKPTANIGLSHNHAPSLASSNTATFPGKGPHAASSISGKHLPASTSANPLRGKSQFHNSGAPRRFSGGMDGHSGPRFSQSHGSFASMGRGGGFRRR